MIRVIFTIATDRAAQMIDDYDGATEDGELTSHLLPITMIRYRYIGFKDPHSKQQLLTRARSHTKSSAQSRIDFVTVLFLTIPLINLNKNLFVSQIEGQLYYRVEKCQTDLATTN